MMEVSIFNLQNFVTMYLTWQFAKLQSSSEFWLTIRHWAYSSMPSVQVKGFFLFVLAGKIQSLCSLVFLGLEQPAEIMPRKRTKISTAAHHGGNESLEESSKDGEAEKEARVHITEVLQQGQSLIIYI